MTELALRTDLILRALQDLLASWMPCIYFIAVTALPVKILLPGEICLGKLYAHEVYLYKSKINTKK